MHSVEDITVATVELRVQNLFMHREDQNDMFPKMQWVVSYVSTFIINLPVQIII